MNDNFYIFAALNQLPNHKHKEMETLSNLPPATPESVWAIMQESTLRSEQERKKFREEFEQSLKESREEFDQSLKKSREEFDKQTKAFREDLRKTEKMIEANRREIGGITHSNGEVAESYFINSFKKNPHFAGQDFQFLYDKKSCYSKELELQDEYDLILTNGSSIVIIEIKYKARKDDVEQVLKKAESFRKLLPTYKDFVVYLGLAGLHVYQNAENEAKKQGVAIIKQVGKTMMVNDKNLKVF